MSRSRIFTVFNLSCSSPFSLDDDHDDANNRN